MGVLFNVYIERVSDLQDEKVLKIDGGNGSTL